MQKLTVNVYLQMAGPSDFASAKVKVTNTYPMSTPGESSVAIGAYVGTRDVIQDLPPEIKGSHYGVTALVVAA